MGEFIADVVVPAVIGSVVIGVAAETGQQLGQAHAAVQTSGDQEQTSGEAAAEEPARVYEDNPKHKDTPTVDSKGRAVSSAPTNGQGALDNSVQVKNTSPRRVGVDPDTGEFVVLDRHTESAGEGQPERYHGHTRPWQGLNQQQQNALRRSGLVDKKGNPTPGGTQ